jgi:ABC-type glycerol-3-phosphate transport system substrate-binding protein
MRRLVKGVALAAGLTLTLAACSSSDDSGAEAESGSSLTIWADEKRAEPIGALATTWGEENGVEVTVQVRALVRGTWTDWGVAVGTPGS